ncbi:flagellar protein FlaG [Janthinobacterium sp. J1-1]|uniref:flagellar protein FlaG n=1 Tax=Janthinobacterium sp. J1-1 TaxID=3065910 RepID=UPI0028113A92|nr:flagellar protein FlaG [Janthinobacterium sp. J1-1]
MDIQATNGLPAPQLQQQRTAVTPGGATAARPVAAAAIDGKANGKDDPQSELKDVKQAVSEINKAMQFMSRQLEFSVDTDSERTIVKVIDQQTREVIRQMPTKEALEIGKALEKAQGLLIKQTA